MLKVSRSIGRKDFPDAVRLLEEHVARHPQDAAALGLLAQCHRWCGSDDRAIEVAETTIKVDPQAFGSLKLLSEVLAKRGEHQRAAEYVRRGLVQYPEEMAPVAPLLLKFADFATRILRRGRPLPARDLEPWRQINAENREWFEWAKAYLAWFDRRAGESTLPTLH